MRSFRKSNRRFVEKARWHRLRRDQVVAAQSRRTIARRNLGPADKRAFSARNGKPRKAAGRKPKSRLALFGSRVVEILRDTGGALPLARGGHSSTARQALRAR